RHSRIQPRRSRRPEEHDRLAVQTAARQRIERQSRRAMGASPGTTGTARAQSQLRQAFVFTNTYALLQPEVLVGRAHEKFDAEGHLVHEATRDFLATFLQHFTDLLALHAMATARVTP